MGSKWYPFPDQTHVTKPMSPLDYGWFDSCYIKLNLNICRQIYTYIYIFAGKYTHIYIYIRIYIYIAIEHAQYIPIIVGVHLYIKSHKKGIVWLHTPIVYHTIISMGFSGS